MRDRLWRSVPLLALACLALLAATGLRASEAAGLTIGDLTLSERSGWVTRFIGRRLRYSSPVRMKCPSADESNPQNRRIPVPELPQSRTSAGSSSWPLPWTVIVSPLVGPERRYGRSGLGRVSYRQGSPATTSAAAWFWSINSRRSRAYSFESSPATGTSTQSGSVRM